MIGPFVHNIDPIFGSIGGFYLWWYGISYTFGFLGLFFWLKRSRNTLLINASEIFDLTIFMATGVLLGGRLVEVFFYEWAYYSSNPWHIPAVWLGGMSTHGILLGGIIGIALFCWRYNKNFFEIGDVLAIAAAYIMGVGRIGNFIDGQIVGSATSIWWGVKFPDMDDFRHPVVLYDGIKNLLLIPVLIMIRKTKPPRGVIVAHFFLWYGFLRIFVDFFREYRTDFLGFPPGQEFNILMTLMGIGMLVYFYRKSSSRPPDIIPAEPVNNLDLNLQAVSRFRKSVLIILLLLPMMIPSDWTQDVPEKYGNRHYGMRHSALYPPINIPGDAVLVDSDAKFVASEEE